MTVGIHLKTSETELLAENILVSIVPNFEEEQLNLVSGTYGPFYAQTQVEVPLWLAVALKRQQKCQIRCPDWMTAGNLLSKKKAEKEHSTGALEPMPYHYIEIASLILRHAPDDVDEVHKVRSLLEDIENLRQYKIRKGLKATVLQEQEDLVQNVKLSNASAMEIHGIRSFLLETLGKFYFLYSQGLTACRTARERSQDENQSDVVRELNANARRTHAPRIQEQVMPTSQESYDSDEELNALLETGDSQVSTEKEGQRRKLRRNR
mmetsp:Transcript_8205/g.15199  ORF Transcript_8205/g.15199 Transcript_8205/m.15199 type:complete len:265 (+) Transcript_8205:410-1204(+)